jgi:signal transduction histidine kinase/CheY-like chemotaxis protein
VLPLLRGLTTAIVLSVLGAVALLVNAGVAVVSLRHIAETNARVTHTHEVLEELRGLEDGLQDAERVQRGYILTGDRSYLEPYGKGVQDAEARLARLRLFTFDDPLQQGRLAALAPLVTRQLALLRKGVEARSGPGGFERAQEWVRSGVGRAGMDELLRRMAEMKSSEDALLVGRARASALAWNEALASILLGLGASLVLLTAAFVSFRARTRERQEESQRKDQFLAVLAHELRNPLTALRNALGVLARAPPGGEQAARAQAILDRQATHLTRLVDDLLDVSRIASGKIRLRRRPVDLVEVVRAAVQDVRPMYEAKGLTLELAPVAAPVGVDGDATRLAQVVTNLLFNAWKFTDRGGSVTVALGAEQGRAVVRVRDDGAGLDGAMLARIFRPFVQADATLDRSAGGLGLGLALARSIAELHGGTITASSDGPGRGAEFTVSLPLAEPAPAPSPAEPSAPARRVRVLVIEDNEDSAAGLREFLELHGHQAAVAKDGPAGLEAALAWDPDVVFCDVGLPGLDGYEVARRLRAGGSRARLIALTGYARSADVERARRAGFDDHLAKPADLERLVSSLSSAAAWRGGAGSAAAPPG